MTAAILFTVVVAAVASLAFAAWIWFAIRNEASMVFSLGDFDGMHFDNPGPDPATGTTASRSKPWHS
jgi:hypothetical protein